MRIKLLLLLVVVLISLLYYFVLTSEIFEHTDHADTNTSGIISQLPTNERVAISISTSKDLLCRRDGWLGLEGFYLISLATAVDATIDGTGEALLKQLFRQMEICISCRRPPIYNSE